MKQTKDLKELEGKIGYTFKDKTLFKQALTHSSYANEHRHEGLKDNERLEFLGDAVLEIISSEYLFYNYPDMAEGEMTKLRASIVCEPTLALCTHEISLGSYLFLGKGEERTGGRNRDRHKLSGFRAKSVHRTSLSARADTKRPPGYSLQFRPDSLS